MRLCPVLNVPEQLLGSTISILYCLQIGNTIEHLPELHYELQTPLHPSSYLPLSDAAAAASPLCMLGATQYQLFSVQHHHQSLEITPRAWQCSAPVRSAPVRGCGQSAGWQRHVSCHVRRARYTRGREAAAPLIGVERRRTWACMQSVLCRARGDGGGGRGGGHARHAWMPLARMQTL